MQENYFNETLNKPSQPKPLILALIQQKTLKICSSFLMPSLKSRMLVYMFSNTFLNQPCLISLKIYIREKKTIFNKSSTERTHTVK